MALNYRYCIRTKIEESRWQEVKKIVVALVAACALALSLVAVGCSGQAEPAKDDTKNLAVEDKATSDEPFYVLITGNDTRVGTTEINKAEYADGNARTDTMMLARVNPKTYTVTLITIPRDTAIQLDGKTTKINEAYRWQGMDGTLKAVEELTGTEVRYYLNTTFVDFENLVNKLGGVTVDVPIPMSLVDIVSGNNVSLQAGEQDLDGAEALVLARTRKAYSNDQDANRQIQDRNIIMALIEKVAAVPGTVDSAVQALYDNCETNWDQAEMTSLVQDFANNASKIVIFSCTGPYTGGTDPSSGTWVATRDEATWARIIAMANEDKNPLEIVPLPSSY